MVQKLYPDEVRNVPEIRHLLYSIIHNSRRHDQEKCGEIVKHKPGVKAKCTDSEIIALTLARELLSFTSERCFLDFMKANASHLFPNLIKQSQFNRRTRYLYPAINQLRHMLLSGLDVQSDPCRVIDTTDVPVVKFSRASYTNLFRGEAAYGHSSSKKMTYYGFKLFIRVNPISS